MAEVAVSAIVIDDGRLLLVRRGRAPDAGCWSVPGGRVLGGELLAEAVVRELAEETGLEGVCGPLIGVAERVTDAFHYVILGYAVTLLDPTIDPAAGSDATEAAWVDLETVAEWHLVDGLAEFLHDHGLIRAIV